MSEDMQYLFQSDLAFTAARTHSLRWSKDGVLEQAWEVVKRVDHKPVERFLSWRPVPLEV